MWKALDDLPGKDERGPFNQTLELFQRQQGELLRGSGAHRYDLELNRELELVTWRKSLTFAMILYSSFHFTDRIHQCSCICQTRLWSVECPLVCPLHKWNSITDWSLQQFCLPFRVADEPCKHLSSPLYDFIMVSSGILHLVLLGDG